MVSVTWKIDFKCYFATTNALVSLSSGCTLENPAVTAENPRNENPGKKNDKALVNKK